MKIGKWLVWVFAAVAVFVLARTAFQQFDLFGGRELYFPQFHGNGFSHGGQAFRNGVEIHGMRGRMPGGHMHGFGILPFLIQVGLVVVGWVIWKLAAGNRIHKWAGIILMAWGAVLLLPKLFILPVILVAAYFVYKMRKNKNEFSTEYVTAAPASLDSHKYDYLDEWEHAIRKEEQ